MPAWLGMCRQHIFVSFYVTLYCGTGIRQVFLNCISHETAPYPEMAIIDDSNHCVHVGAKSLVEVVDQFLLGRNLVGIICLVLSLLILVNEMHVFVGACMSWFWHLNNPELLKILLALVITK